MCKESFLIPKGTKAGLRASQPRATRLSAETVESSAGQNEKATPNFQDYIKLSYQNFNSYHSLFIPCYAYYILYSHFIDEETEASKDKVVLSHSNK